MLRPSSVALYLTWQPWFAAVLFTSIVVNFLFGKWLRAKAHWLPLSAGIFFNLALLAAFKYVPPLTFHILPSSLRNATRLALPLGISFWTFQALSYLFDLYRGEELDPTFDEFALYMVFFPVTISGPVCRMPDMLPQFRSEETTAWSDIGLGLRRIAIGVFMMQLGKLLARDSGRRWHRQRIRPRNAVVGDRCLVSRLRLWTTTLLRLRRLHAYCRGRGQGIGYHRAGKLRAAV